MTRNLTTYPLSLVIGLYLSCCQPSEDYRLFTDLPAEKSGVVFANNLSDAEDFNMIDYLYYYDGGGVAIGDINNDGRSDIYLVSNEGTNGLFLNQGQMRFVDITETAGVGSPGRWKTGVSMADVNGDGLLDIYLCRLGDYKGVTGKNQLFINQGDLTFKEQAEAYNLDFSGFSTHAGFFDLENDGDLDVYLLNHSVHSARTFGDAGLRHEVDSLAGDRIYRNDNNYFVDISQAAGIYRSQIGYGLGISFSDVNRDGFTDIFVANDFSENDYLYLNNGDGTFVDRFPEMADYTSLSSMGCDLADFNNDGLVDIIILDMLPQDETVRKSTVGEDPQEIFRMKLEQGYMPQYKRNMLQLNMGNGTFSEIAMMAGVHATDWSWAPLFADFNNDGLKDLFITNGIKGRPNDLDYLAFIETPQIKNNPGVPDSMLLNQMPSGMVSNYFYQNNGDLTFKDVSIAWGAGNPVITQGAAYGDLDNDGDLDLVLNNFDKPAVIKENNTVNGSVNAHFLQLELTGNTGNTHAIGTTIEVFNDDHFQLFEMYPTRGFKSSVDNRLHIGLGSSIEVDSIRIGWPGGTQSILYQVPADTLVSLSITHGTSKPPNTTSPETPVFSMVPNHTLGVEYVHRENTFIEFNREPLLPHMHSQEGPALAVADVNGDGLDDFYIGGAKHQEGSIYLQTKHGFQLTTQPSLMQDRISEDVDAVFFDFDRDNDQDLLVVSGGNEFVDQSPERQPRLYVNDGKGSFSRKPEFFQTVYQTGSCVAVEDYDHDGWPDIFLGSQVVPWNYGRIPRSYLIKNQAGRSFLDVTESLPDQGYLGMINDAVWADLDGNREKSLVLVGEWMDISILSWDGKSFAKRTIPASSGWWKSVDQIDWDGDGDQDLLVGNLGLNSKLKVTEDGPLNIYLNDFDQNGKAEGVITSFINGRQSVFSPREILIKQIPSIYLKFPDNRSFAQASPKDILGVEGFEQATVLITEELRSGVFINDPGGFRFQPFTNNLQVSFIQDFLTRDFNNDGLEDLLLAGNLFAASIVEGRYAAGRGALIMGIPVNPDGIPVSRAGILQKGDIRKLEVLDFQGRLLIMAASNNDSIQWFNQK